MVKYSDNQKDKMVEWAKKRIPKDKEFDPQTIDWKQEIFTDEERIEEVWTKFKNYIKDRYDLSLEEYEEDEYLHYMREARKNYEKQILGSMEEAPKIDVQRAMEEIANYTKKGEEFTYSTLISLITGTSVINYGPAGCGKSRSSKDLVDELDIPKTIVQVGYMTPKSFYQFIEAHKDCIVVLDEADMLLDKKKINEMIKTLLSNGELAWKTDRENLKTEFEGSLIVNCNQKSFSRCVEDKLIVNNKGYSTDDYKEKIEHARNYKKDEEIWEAIRKRVVFTRNNPMELNEKEKEMIYEFIKELNYIGSFRDKMRIFDTFRGLKNLFGTLTEYSVFEKGRELARKSIGGDIVDKIVAKYPMDEPFKRKELKEKIASAKSISERQANREINKLVKNEKVHKKNRTTLVKKSEVM